MEVRYVFFKNGSQVSYSDSDTGFTAVGIVILGISEHRIASTHTVLIRSEIPQKKVEMMIREMEKVDGVKYVIGLEKFIGAGIPKEFLPKSVTSLMEGEKWKLLVINSNFKVASDDVNMQLNELKQILKKNDKDGMLIGEASCVKDLIETTDRDFKIVNTISIVAIFIIIALVLKSITLPVLLIAVIEAAIFVNLSIPHYFGEHLPFIAPICISTIQLGATVDYAILMTTRYKNERMNGRGRHDSVITTLSYSSSSIIMSGIGLFAATFGVAMYSDIKMIGSICMLMARGAVISVLMVIFILPALLMIGDKMICRTTAGMRKSLK